MRRLNIPQTRVTAEIMLWVDIPHGFGAHCFEGRRWMVMLNFWRKRAWPFFTIQYANWRPKGVA